MPHGTRKLKIIILFDEQQQQKTAAAAAAAASTFQRATQQLGCTSPPQNAATIDMEI